MNQKKQNKYYLSWEEYDNLATLLAKAIAASDEEYRFIYGVPRGGLILATILSHKLNIPMHVSRYQLFLEHMENLSLHKLDYKYLIVDDITDSGDTLYSIYGVSKYTKHIATMYKRDTCKHTPMYYVKENKDWIVFPYETDNDKISQVKYNA